jgi:hypothetical protein
MALPTQAFYLFILAIPIACVTWTITHEDIVREAREWCSEKSRECPKVYERKFFYLFTCEYCFSHYVTLVFLWITRFHLLLAGWRGYLIAGFALVWLANIYMSIFGRVRLSIKGERVAIQSEEKALARQQREFPLELGERDPHPSYR